MWPDQVSNPGLLALESDAFPTTLRGPTQKIGEAGERSCDPWIGSQALLIKYVFGLTVLHFEFLETAN